MLSLRLSAFGGGHLPGTSNLPFSGCLALCFVRVVDCLKEEDNAENEEDNAKQSDGKGDGRDAI